MKPTAGPWEIDDDEHRVDGIGRVHLYRVVAEDGAVVAEFSNAGCNEILTEFDGEGGVTHSDQQAMANAYLIAAAPELYAALAEIIDIWEPYPGGSAEETWKAGKTALEKARRFLDVISAR